MQKGALAHLSTGAKLLVVLMLILLSAVVFSMLAMTFGMLLYDFSVAEVQQVLSSPAGDAQLEFMKFFQGLTSLGMFLAPAWLGAFLFSERPSELMSAERLPYRMPLLLLLVTALSLSGAVISDLCYQITLSFDFPESWLPFKEMLDESQRAMEAIYDRLLQMDNFMDFTSVLLVMAIIPAVCEEALFRGLLQPIMQKSVGVHLGIVATSLIFAVIHQQFYAFLSIFVLGMALGYVRYWSNSLWLSTWMHFVNNGVIVFTVYFFDVSYSETNNTDEALAGWQYVVGVVVFGLLLLVAQRFLTTNRADEIAEGH